MRGWFEVISLCAAMGAMLAVGWLLRRPGVNKLWGLAYWSAIALGLTILFNVFR